MTREQAGFDRAAPEDGSGWAAGSPSGRRRSPLRAAADVVRATRPTHRRAPLPGAGARWDGWPVGMTATTDALRIRARPSQPERARFGVLESG
jgi:hypothetical protein